MGSDELCEATSPGKKSKTRTGASIRRELEFIGDPPLNRGVRFVSVSESF